jgi:hypothetical protein
LQTLHTLLQGTLTAVVTGLLFILGQHTPLAAFWRTDAAAMVVSSAVAGAVAVAVSGLVAPSLANDEASFGAAVSAYLSIENIHCP